MHGADAEAVVAKGLKWQGPEGRLLFSKHRGDVALRGAMDARVGPVGFPAIEIRLRLVERLEAEAAEWRLLRMTDAGFDFALAIGIADGTATRRRRSARARRGTGD